MNQFFMALVLILGAASWYLWTENQTLQFNNAQLESSIAQQEEAIAVMKENYERQGQALNQLSSRNAEIEGEMNRYMDIFRRHNLNQLAAAKPGLLENKMNNATSRIFREIENDSKELDSLDNPSADINPNN